VVAEAVTVVELWSGTLPAISAVVESATAIATPDAVVVAMRRSAMIPSAFVNSSTSRQANVAGVMVNL
jgi:hypothetical protein